MAFLPFPHKDTAALKTIALTENHVQSHDL